LVLDFRGRVLCDPHRSDACRLEPGGDGFPPGCRSGRPGHRLVRGLRTDSALSAGLAQGNPSRRAARLGASPGPPGPGAWTGTYRPVVPGLACRQAALLAAPDENAV